MAEMDLETVKAELQKRFAAPLPEFYTRRIIFWHDEAREFADYIRELTIPGVTVVCLTGRNAFAVKQRICLTEPDTNFLVYCPVSYAREEENWLLNVELYSETFRADRISLWMEELQLPEGEAVRAQLERYRKFFNAKDRRGKVAALDRRPRTAGEVRLSVLTVLAGVKEMEPSAILTAVLAAGLEEDNAIWAKLTANGAAEDFLAMTQRYFGYAADTVSLGDLAAHLFLNAASRTMKVMPVELDRWLVGERQAYCYDAVMEWIRRDEASAGRAAREVESRLGLRTLFGRLPLEALYETGCFPCIHECLLQDFQQEIGGHIVRADVIRRVVEARRGMPWYGQWARWYDGLLQLAEMVDFRKSHEEGFHHVKAEELWRAYTSEYFRMDMYYRRFQRDFQETLRSDAQDFFKQAAEEAEQLYTGWYLEELGRNWADAAADDFARIGHAEGVPQQETFYVEKVRSASERVFVIISDALRYEVGAELAGCLRQTRGRVKLEAREAIFPTVTKCGMAALLPHRALTMEKRAGGFQMLADGRPTDAPNREKILQAACMDSAALRAEDLFQLKREARKVLVKGKRVVYIYHDRIDEMSHTVDSEVFRACEEAIRDILNLVRIITSDFSGAHILITADHGFLYTNQQIREDGKVDAAGEEVDRRYVIAKKGAAPEGLLPVALPAAGGEYTAYAPMPNVRIRKKGGGLNFVHGGISLQELVVPVIDYHFLRTDSREYRRSRDVIDTRPVRLTLLSSMHKISSEVFSLDFFQQDVAGGNREAAAFRLYFTDEEGRAVSDVQTVFAGRTDEVGQDRTYRCTFRLKPLSFSPHRRYLLHIEEESGRLEAMDIPFQIDLAFTFDSVPLFE